MSIEQNAFYGLERLRYLDLELNYIRGLQNGSLNGLLSVNEIILRRNHLSLVEPGSFQNLKQLKTLFLNGNRLVHIDDKIFAGLLSLKTLELSSNIINKIDFGAFTFMNVPGDQKLVLRLMDNRISALSWKIFSGRSAKNRMTNKKFKRIVLELNNNKLKCGLDLCWIVTGVNENWLEVNVNFWLWDKKENAFISLGVDLQCQMNLENQCPKMGM